jgi:hypothetical protein
LRIVDFKFLISDWRLNRSPFSFESEILNPKSQIVLCLPTLRLFPRARTSVRHARPGLVGDEVREEVGQNAEQRQATNAVGGENPCSAAFMMMKFGSRRGLLGVGRRNAWGPIFHAKNLLTERSWRNVQYASRLPRVMGRQDYLRVILPRFQGVGEGKLLYFAQIDGQKWAKYCLYLRSMITVAARADRLRRPASGVQVITSPIG